MAAGFDIAKAGWLHRESSVLHRWKRQWFVLDKVGDLRYFETPDHPMAEERIVVRAAVGRIRTGVDVGSVSLPDNLSKGCVMVLDMVNGNHMTLCADSPDDLKAWHISLEEAKTVYHQPAVQVMGNTTVIGRPMGNTTVIGRPMGNTTVIGQPMGNTTVISAPGVYGGGYGGYYSGYPGRVISTPGVTVIPAQQSVTCIPGNGIAGATVINGAPQQVVYMNGRSPYYSRGLFW